MPLRYATLESALTIAVTTIERGSNELLRHNPPCRPSIESPSHASDIFPLPSPLTVLKLKPSAVNRLSSSVPLIIVRIESGDSSARCPKSLNVYANISASLSVTIFEIQSFGIACVNVFGEGFELLSANIYTDISRLLIRHFYRAYSVNIRSHVRTHVLTQ